MRVGRCLVRGSYRRQKLAAVRPRPGKRWTTDSDHGYPASPNLLEGGKNKPTGPGEVIVGDITYPALLRGKFSYLTMFQDMFTKQIVGWAVSRSLEAGIVITALKKAISKGMLKKTAIVHTDQGSQYVSKEYRKLFTADGLRQSMSRRGSCWDNAQAESFFARFKTELLEGGKFDSHETAKSETFVYIEGYYNDRRPHSALGNMAPDEFAVWHKQTNRAEKNDKPVLETAETLPPVKTLNPAHQAAI